MLNLTGACTVPGDGMYTRLYCAHMYIIARRTQYARIACIRVLVGVDRFVAFFGLSAAQRSLALGYNVVARCRPTFNLFTLGTHSTHAPCHPNARHLPLWKQMTPLQSQFLTGITRQILCPHTSSLFEPKRLEPSSLHL